MTLRLVREKMSVYEYLQRVEQSHTVHMKLQLQAPSGVVSQAVVARGVIIPK